MLVVMRS
jgi:hypothetical protein